MEAIVTVLDNIIGGREATVDDLSVFDIPDIWQTASEVVFDRHRYVDACRERYMLLKISFTRLVVRRCV